MEEYVKVIAPNGEEVWQKQITIDWEQRRYEIAKDALVGLLTNWGAGNPSSLIPSAVKYADALIEELKK